MIQDNCFYRVSIKALILDDTNRFLLSKEPDGKWDFPGGGLEFGESIQVALKREINEELGILATDIHTSPSYFITFNKVGTDAWMANVFYETKLENFEFKPSDECIDIKFFTPEEAVSMPNNGNVSEFAKAFNQLMGTQATNLLFDQSTKL